ncbi:hypothetical protein [Noviherbaspirillum sedimenti]|nr:hypothetical protein [Noviherbaspirillum sedimenti]
MDVKLLKSMQTSRRTKEITYELELLDGQIVRLGNDRDLDMQRLYERRSRANNNLAGATLEQSINTEMQALNGVHDSKVKIIQDKQKVLRAELDSLKAGK